MNMDMRDIIDISTNEVVGQAPWYNGEELAKMVDSGIRRTAGLGACTAL